VPEALARARDALPLEWRAPDEEDEERDEDSDHEQKQKGKRTRIIVTSTTSVTKIANRNCSRKKIRARTAQPMSPVRDPSELLSNRLSGSLLDLERTSREET
jgi:hypothetical protein